MINLFSDFGASDIYLGQMKAAVIRTAPEIQMIDLLHDATAFNVQAAAHLLAALLLKNPADVTLAVVDPGVGGPRRPLAIETEFGWLVGPDNGLLSVVAARSSRVRIHEILWRPSHLSSTFHGRDLFAPIAAQIAIDRLPLGALCEIPSLAVSFGDQDMAQVIYIDHYGNAMTGIRVGGAGIHGKLRCRDNLLTSARCFSDVPAGQAFCYENSLGLMEIAVNGGSAAEALGLMVGMEINVV